MNIKHFPLYLLFFLCSTEAFSQLTESEEELIAPSLSMSRDIDYSLEFNLKGLGGTGETLPFWLYHNQRGRVTEDTYASAWMSGKKALFLSRNSYLILGAGILYDQGSDKGVQIDELFAHYQNSWMYATLGRKQQKEYYNGLSSTNNSIFWSLNARPMPGIRIGTTKPLFLSGNEGFGAEGSWNEYLMGNDRFVKGAKTHHKELRLVFKKGSWEIKAGLQHIVQWSGNSPRHGDLHGGFEDYLRVIFGSEGTEYTEGEINTVLGNVLGGYEAYVSKEFRDFKLQFIYNHLFEDASGQRLGNTPDGRYGVYYENNEKERLINSVIYEFYYTEHQSHTTSGVHKYDRYFHHGIYRSGWTYEGRVIGSPFFTPDPSGEGFLNNKFRAHHIGIGGQWPNLIHTIPYKLLLSFARNDGTYALRYRPKQNVFYGLLDVGLLRTTIDLNVQAGVELNNTASPKFGAGVHLVYKL